jgi:hypothetical protein
MATLAEEMCGSDTTNRDGVQITRAVRVDISQLERPGTAASADSFADESRLRRPDRATCLLTVPTSLEMFTDCSITLERREKTADRQ